MAREPVQKEVEGVKYTFGRHTPKKSRKLFNRILKIIAPTLSAGIGITSLQGLDKILDKDIDIPSAISTLCERMDEPEIEAILDTVLGEVIHNGNGDIKGLGNCRDNYDAVFLDIPVLHVYKVFGEALLVEYDNFFGEGAGLREVIEKEKSKITDTTPEKQI